MCVRSPPCTTCCKKAVDRLNSTVQEGLIAIRTVKAFVRGEYEKEKFDTVNQTLMDTSEKTFHYAVLNTPAFQLTLYTAVILIMWFGGGMILDASLQVGELTGFLSYVFQIMNSMMMISNVFLLLTRSLASAHRIREVLDEEVVLTSPENGVTEIPDGSVSFEMSLLNTIPRQRNTPCHRSICASSRGRRWVSLAGPARPRAHWCS